MAAVISIRQLTKVFKDKNSERRVLDGISLEVEEGSLTTLVGPSGCGKTTLLNVLAGIEPATSGEIRIRDSGERGAQLGYVFQHPRLLPWLTIEDNLMFVRPSYVEDALHRPRVRGYLQMVGLAEEAHKFPHQLSGGMQQRAGLGRALCVEPAVLLMDEPFSHLDEITAEGMREELVRIWRKTGRTILFVTHDIHEAVELGDRMVILGLQGRIFDDLPIALPRPRDFADPAFVAVHADSVRRFRRMQELSVEDPGVKVRA